MSKPNAQFPKGYKKNAEPDPKVMEEEKQKLEEQDDRPEKGK